MGIMLDKVVTDAREGSNVIDTILRILSQKKKLIKFFNSSLKSIKLIKFYEVHIPHTQMTHQSNNPFDSLQGHLLGRTLLTTHLRM